MNNWTEYSRLVLSKLDSHEKLLSDMQKEIQTIRVDQAVTKVKIALIGAATGIFGGVGVNVVKNLFVG